jgi:hypothetical protein
VLGPEEGVWGGWWHKARVAVRRNLGITQRGRRGKVYLRVVRSVVLVAKVCLYFAFVNHITYVLLIRCRC